jgi:acyl carrier protein
VPLGRPLARNELLVLDRFRQPVPPGVPGELFIGGAQVVRGYWQRPELTAERFVRHPFGDDPSARLYRTGDLVRWLADGTLEFLGRTDFQVKIRGYRIELGEIEAVLSGVPEVREAVVTARRDSAGDVVRLVGYLVWRDGGRGGSDDTARVAALRDRLRAALPAFMVPAHLVPLRELPRTPNGKVDRQALPAPEVVVAHAAAPVEAVATAGELEAQIAAVWCDVLKRPAVGALDNFFDLGGHSLLAVQVHGRLRQALQRDLSITDLFRFPTVRTLATFLGGDTTDEAAQGGAARAAQRREMLARRNRRLQA